MQSLEIANLPVDFSKVLAGNRIDCIARAISLVGQLEQVTNLIEGKAEVASTPNEA